MLTLLTLWLLVQPAVTAQGQPATPEAPPVEVLGLEVLVSVYKPRGLVGSRVPPPPPGVISGDAIPGRGGGSGRPEKPTIADRSGELSKVARRGPQPTPVIVSSPVYVYEYRLRFKNAGGEKIRSILWEYQLRDASNTSTLSRRLFLCGARVRPGGVKVLGARTLSAPRNVVSADAPDESLKQRAVINRVEYADGSVWQRGGWEPAGSKRADPAEWARVLRDGRCMAW